MKVVIISMIAAVLLFGSAIGGNVYLNARKRSAEDQELARLKKEGQDAQQQFDQFVKRQQGYLERHTEVSRSALRMLKEGMPSASVDAWEKEEDRKIDDEKRHQELLDAIKTAGKSK